MNRLNWIHAAALAALLPIAASTAIAEDVDEVREALPDAVIEFAGVTGDFTVVGSDADELRVRGTLGRDVEELRIDGDSGRWRIKVEMKESSGWNWGSGPETRLEITVPRGSDLSAQVVSADLELRGLRGPRLDVRTVSGDLVVTDSSPARLMAETVSGDLEIDGGGLESNALKSVSGDIEARGLAGRLRVGSVSGELSIDAIEVSEFEGETVSGDIEAALRTLASATIDLQTHSGSLVLSLPAGTAVDVDAETFSGDLSSEFDADIENFRERGMTVRSGDGSVRVRAQTFSGEFELLQSGG